jgi:hypothetical protein
MRIDIDMLHADQVSKQAKIASPSIVRHQDYNECTIRNISDVLAVWQKLITTDLKLPRHRKVGSHQVINYFRVAKTAIRADGT